MAKDNGKPPLNPKFLDIWNQHLPNAEHYRMIKGLLKNKQQVFFD